MITEYKDLCIICGCPATDAHHIFKGHKQRHLADADELILPLCRAHHEAVHTGRHNKEFNTLCEIIGQLAYEKRKCAEGYGEGAARESFRLRYGRSYL